MTIQPAESQLCTTGSAQRAEEIARRLGSSQGGSYVLYRGEYRELPVIRLPIGLLLYRADNGRMIMQLQELQRRQGLPPNSFSTNQESPEVQHQLHALLLDLAKDPGGPIFQELKRQAQQTEPLLITADGVVVNGNRRLAAMRALLAQDHQTYHGFQEVRVAVLPSDARTEDIEYVEAALQLAPETKLAYSWINRRLKLRRQRDELGLPVEQILESYRLEGTQALDKELRELELAEDYLEHYRGDPGHYALVEDAEKLFVGLSQTLDGLEGWERDLWRLAGFALIEARQELDQDLVTTFPFAESKPASMPRHALVMLAVEEGLLTENQTSLATDMPESIKRELADTLGQRGEAPRLAREMLDILEQIRIDHQEKNAPQRLIKRVRQIRQLMERLEEGSLSPKQQAKVGSELAAIAHHSRRLLGESKGSLPMVGGFAERAKGLDPEEPSLSVGLTHALRAILGRSLSRRLGRLLSRES